MGKTRALFKKIRYTKGTFYAKMGSIKHRNGMDLTEAKDTKRWQAYKEVQLLVNICCPCKKKKKEEEEEEYTEELYKKDLHDADNHDGVNTDLEPDILECEVKWTLGSITYKQN